MRLYQINSYSWVTDTGINISIINLNKEFYIEINYETFSTNILGKPDFFKTVDEAIQTVKSFFKIED